MRPLKTTSRRKTRGNRSTSNFHIYPDFTFDEMGLLRDSIEDSIDFTKRSKLNINLSKRQAFDILLNKAFFSNSDKYGSNFVGYLHSYNVLREFVFNKKTLTDKDYEKLKTMTLIFDNNDLRKKKLNKINNKIIRIL